jgi:hypothetical protein
MRSTLGWGSANFTLRPFYPVKEPGVRLTHRIDDSKRHRGVPDDVTKRKIEPRSSMYQRRVLED